MYTKKKPIRPEKANEKKTEDSTLLPLAGQLFVVFE